MKTHHRLTVVVGLLGVIAGMGIDRVIVAQQAAVRRTELQRADVPRNAGYEAVMAIAELPAGATSGKHRHPGFELGYVLEGTLVVEHEGRPIATLKAGDSLKHDGVHDVRNAGKTTAKALGVYIIEKGKPIAEPVK